MKNYGKKNILILFLLAFIIRILFAMYHKGFLTDTGCFWAWAMRVYEGGFGAFYSPDSFTDYPPGYMYILYFIGMLHSKLSLGYLSAGSLLLLRLPAILCDLLAGYFLYRCANKNHTEKVGFYFAMAYLFNPATILNSSIWGQVDAIYALLIVSIILLLMEGKTIPAYFVYGLGILVKPQVLIFTPILLYGIWEHVFVKDFSFKKFCQNLLSGVLAILCTILLALPFGPDKVITQYTDTLSSYPYATVNAYNFWGLLGKNWMHQESSFLFTTYQNVGTFMLVFLTLLSGVIFYLCRKCKERYFVTASFIIITTFLFSVRMHERYLFPAMLLLLFTFLYRRHKAFVLSYGFISVSHFLNVWYVLRYYDPSTFNPTAFGIISISLLTVVSGIYFYTQLVRYLQCPEKTHRDEILPKAITAKMPLLLRKPKPSSHACKITHADIAIMVAITIFYAFFALKDLGYTRAPQTEQSVAYGDSILLTCEEYVPSTVYFYLMNQQDITFSLYTLNEDSYEWIYEKDITMQNVFHWGSFTIDTPAKQILLLNITKDTKIAEMVLISDIGVIFQPANTEDYPALFDEADCIPATFDHLSGTYFDEIYYTRTVYEMLNGLPTYENTHPPLGKVFMTIGAAIFGLTPFGFRIAGTLFGIAMLPFLYLLSRNITGSRKIGAFCAFLFAYDFMHFTQTRLTTIDVFVTFFIIGMYYYMDKYRRLSFYDTPLKEMFIPLGMCGIFFGLGIASKWTGAYAGVGLAIIFFYQLFKRYGEYRYALSSPKDQTEGISHQLIISSFREKTIKTIGFCLVFFVAIPFVIYLLSYIPFVDASHPGLFERMYHNQINMFNYHAHLDATHPYSSMWYEWPTMVRPIFYYSNVLDGTLRQGISAFGNPIIWWGGFICFAVTLFYAFKKRSAVAGFISIGYLAQFLPWTLVSRCTFIYHYFPSVPFLILAIGFIFSLLRGKVNERIFTFLLVSVALLAFALFLLFYPVISGSVVSADYVANYLRWMDGWVLTFG